MSCRDEHDHHDHDHGGGGHAGHSHEVPLESGPNDSLFGQIDIEHVTALNAQEGGESGQRVIKPWDEREDETKWCESDADDTLIIHIPFTASVSLRSISIKAGPSGKTPSALHLYKDGLGMDFSDADARPPTQILEVVETRESAEYQVKAAKFAGMTSLTIYIPNNNSDGEEETTRLYYIGLRGKHTALPNELGQIIYESAARPTDHKMEHVTEGQSWRPGY